MQLQYKYFGKTIQATNITIQYHANTIPIQYHTNTMQLQYKYTSTTQVQDKYDASTIQNTGNSPALFFFIYCGGEDGGGIRFCIPPIGCLKCHEYIAALSNACEIHIQLQVQLKRETKYNANTIQVQYKYNAKTMQIQYKYSTKYNTRPTLRPRLGATRSLSFCTPTHNTF